MNAERLLAHYERIADAPDAIARLRRFILDLAVRGKLVPQDPNDESASELLKRITAEKARLVKEGKLKKAEPVVNLTSSDPDIPVPHGWAITNLQSICNSVTDGDHLPPPKAETGIPFLVIGNVRSQRIDFVGSRFVPLKYYEALDPIRRPRSGDLLYTLVGSYGIPVIVRDDMPFCVQRHIGILRPSALIDVNFLARAMESRSAFDQATACATGIAQKTVPLAGLRRLFLPLPPLAEQRRIVAKVDELMALCDRLEVTRASREAVRDRLAAASLARLNAPDPETFQADARFALDALPALTARPDQIKQLRQAILNLAVRGRLVPQDPNDQPAAELLRQIAALKQRSTNDLETSDGEFRREAAELFELPISWQVVPLSDLLISSFYGPRFGADEYSPNGIPTIRTTDMTSDGRIVLRDPPRVSVPENRLQDFRCLRGDLLVTRSGSIGTMAIFDADYLAIPSAYLIRFRFSPSISVRYIHLSLRSPDGQEALGLGTTRVAQPNINARSISAIPIRLPPLVEQHRIVAKVDALMALCDRLEASLTAAAATRRRLLDALLAEALAPAEDRELEAAE